MSGLSNGANQVEVKHSAKYKKEHSNSPSCLLYPQSLEDVLVGNVVGRILLDVGEHGGRPASSHHHTAALEKIIQAQKIIESYNYLLVAVTLSQVSPHLQTLGPGAGVSPLLGESRWQDLHQRVPLEAELVVALLLRVQEQFTVKIFPIQELLQSESLQADANESAMLIR